MRLGPIVGSLLGAFGGRALGNALGGRTGGMIGSLAGSLLAGQMGQSAGRGGGLGGLLGGLLGGQKSNDVAGQSAQPAHLAEAQSIPDLDDHHAMLLISAMCSAAKSDGSVDEAEINAIAGRLGDLDEDEKAMLRRELSGPVDVQGLVSRVPKGFENEVYAASLLAIDSVNGAEADYLRQLAAGLQLDSDTVAEITRAVAA